MNLVRIEVIGLPRPRANVRDNLAMDVAYAIAHRIHVEDMMSFGIQAVLIRGERASYLVHSDGEIVDNPDFSHPLMNEFYAQVLQERLDAIAHTSGA